MMKLGKKDDNAGGGLRLDKRIATLEAEVMELRALNRRMADLVDVVTELLVPALDRDDARVMAALARLEGTPED